jgi:hypothetical protein
MQNAPEHPAAGEPPRPAGSGPHAGITARTARSVPPAAAVVACNRISCVHIGSPLPDRREDYDVAAYPVVDPPDGHRPPATPI